MLVKLLEQEAVPFETLHTRNGSLLELVRKVIGVVPNCVPYLEIWPTAFRSYKVMVPNLLNLPFMLWGVGVPRSALGLAVYVSSRAAGCAYCSAYTCTFALLRGATVEKVAAVLRAADRAARALAHGHAAYELHPMLEGPDEVSFAPLITLLDLARAAFGQRTSTMRSRWPEIGGRAFNRAWGTNPDLVERVGDWLVVEAGPYRHSVVEDSGVLVRIGLSKYLACTVY